MNETRHELPPTELDRALGQLETLAGNVLTTEGRLRALLAANQAIVEHLDLPVVLQRIIDVAVDLVGAEYGALGVIGAHGGLEQLIYVGMSARDEEIIGHLPKGYGVLGALIDDPRPIRLRKLTTDPRSVGFPAHHPPMDSFLGVPVRVRDEVFGNLYLTNSSSGAFSFDDEELVTALAATAGIAIDNARLYSETRRRQAWAAASAEITAAMLSASRRDALEILATRVRLIADACRAYVLRPTNDPAHYSVDTASGWHAEELDGSVVPVAGSVFETVIEGRQPRLLSGDGPGGLSGDGHAGLSGDGHDGLSGDGHAGEGDSALGPTMVLPLVTSARLLGILVIERAHGAVDFSRADLEMAADFAGQASVAMELARATEDEQRMVLLEDRSRIARDLHDHVIQQLFGTGLELQSVLGAIGPGVEADRIEGAITSLDIAIAQIRTAVFALSSSRAAGRDLARHRIIDVVSAVSSGFPRTPRVEFGGPVDLVITDDLADDVTAVARELLANTAKHANADNVSVKVVVQDGLIIVEVSDDGVGVSCPPDRQSGLANLARRAELRGGVFRIGSGQGTTLAHWSVPVPQTGMDGR